MPTTARFIMPTEPNNGSSAESTRHWNRRLQERQASSTGHDDAPYWFSFDAGPVHFVVVNTELPLWANTPVRASCHALPVLMFRLIWLQQIGYSKLSTDRIA